MLTASHHSYTLHFKRPIGTSRGTLHYREIYFLRLIQGNVVGWGECSPVAGLSVDDGPSLAADLDRICTAISCGAPTQAFDLRTLPTVAFALETALRDLDSGGCQRLFASAFTCGQQLLPTHGLIWMDGLDGLLRQIEEKIAAGYRVIKMKVGALPFPAECELLAALRTRFSVDQVAIRLDANGAFTPDDALFKLHELAAFGIHFLEQPIKPGQWPQMAELCACSPIPIGLDEELIGIQAEATRVELLDEIRPQHLIIKPTLLGGLAASEAWIALAEARGLDWWVNSALETNVGLNAIAQWLASKNDDRIHGLGTGQLYANNIPAPIRLAGPGLIYDSTTAWDFSPIYAQ